MASWYYKKIKARLVLPASGCLVLHDRVQKLVELLALADGVQQELLKVRTFETSNQCYKPFTGLYLQVCKYRQFLNSFVA